MPEINYGYEKMLEISTKHNPTDSELNKLAKFMTAEPVRIPAGYIYLGQFINHDISLDSTVLDDSPPVDGISPATISNKRSPFLNLDTIYGLESPYNPDEPKRKLLLAENSNSLLKLGDTLATSIKNKVFAGKDLPRGIDNPTAQIVDSRNDENLIVAQTQIAFMRFHNAVVRYLNADDSTDTFETARIIVIRHYQWVILKDYLPRVIKKSVLNDVLSSGNRFYFPTGKMPFVPLEFSTAAFRFGHSMISNSYNWNHFFNDDQSPSNATLKKLSKFTGRGGLDGKNKLVSEWTINWNWFYETPNSPRGGKFNYAKEINTRFSSALGKLPNHTAAVPALTFDKNTSLPALDLYRARSVGLPTGQEVAKRILGLEERILKPEQIASLLPASLQYSFSKETPLLFYLLAEAEIEEHGQTLGEVGSRIIAEIIVTLIKLSDPSILMSDFKPNPDFFLYEKDFGMAQMIKFGKTDNQSFDEFNPLG